MPAPLIAAPILAKLAAASAAPAVASALPAAAGGIGLSYAGAPQLGAGLLGQQGIGGSMLTNIPGVPESAAPGAAQAPGGALPPKPSGPEMPALPMAQAGQPDLSRPGGGYTAPQRQRTQVPRLRVP